MVNPDSLSISVSKDTTEFAAGFKVTNNNNSSITFWWKLVRDDDFPKEWKFQVCDANTCYFAGVEQCPPGNPNVMGGMETNANFSVKIKPNGIASNTIMYYNMYSDSDCTNLLTSLPINVSVGTSGTLLDKSNGALALYPNPTVDKFMLNNSKSVSKIEIYNIAGKKMKAFKVTPGMEYPVEDLRNGLYLVRLLDNKEKVVKVVRLSKK